jgi:hypothetical protein
MKSTIVYIHGYGSSPEGDSAQQIKHSFPDQHFIAPHIDHSKDPDTIKQQMDGLAQTLKGHHDPIVVGSSAGGFWADYLGAKHGLKTVLVNPSLRPSTNYKKYNLPPSHYDKYKKLEDTIKDHPRHHMVAFVGDKDDVVPKQHITSVYKKPIILKGESHRLTDMSPVVNMVHSMVGNFPEHN